MNRWVRWISAIALFALLIACQHPKPVGSSAISTPAATPIQIESPVLSVAASSRSTSTQKVAQSPLPYNDRLIDIRSVNNKIALDIRYATTNNFLKRKLYPVARCVLRGAAAKALSQVQDNLVKKGLGLKVYDCYRPLSVQKLMWQALPDSRYVANPANGSRHNRGAAVDITLVDRNGKPGFFCLCRLDSTAVWSTETVPVQYLRVTDIDHARKIEEKLYCDLIRNILGHIPIRGEHLEFYIRIGVRNARLSRRAHVATAFTAGFQNRITGCPGFFDDIGDLFQQNLFRDDDELFGWLCHVGYLLTVIDLIY
jgi:D-alanyl-D-alanine dipeptidase